MLSNSMRIFCRKFLHCRLIIPSSSLINQRNYASEWDAEDWGMNYPDTRDFANEREKFRIQKRMNGMERYDTQILYRDRDATEVNPNIIPTHGDTRVFGCICDTDMNYIVWHKAKKGELGRCECGYWFKVVDADEDD
uniref:Mitochondrial cytochrome c oxidase subunit Vb n=1 Tax=Acrobeloides nanus TaxID=290746 RepID=A0A914DS51_9BILA